MRILWLNWRDIKHPLAGGAEVYTHEVAKRLATHGHEIVLVTSRPKGLPPKEEIDGYTVIRRGGKYTVYLEARRIYHQLKKEGWRPDVVIDEINTVPFLTPKYVKEPIVALIHQLCKDCWKYAVHPLAQPLGWWLEQRLHKPYIQAAKKSNLKVITVSPSTAQDLYDLGYPPNAVAIVPNGLDWDQYKDCNSQKRDLVTYMGRITPYKRLEDLLKAWKIVEENSDAELIIAGRADPWYSARLAKLVKKLNLGRVKLKANVSQQEKKAILAEAKLLVYTSIREGWGQTILEAAGCKTPTVAYKVPGLRDAVRHMETGVLVEPGDMKGLAKAITLILADENLRSKLAENAYQYALNFDWDFTFKEFLRVIQDSDTRRGRRLYQ